MATTLDTFDFSQPSDLTKTDRRVYPWDDWFDGKIWQITYQEDFDAHPLMMERIIRTRATAKGTQVRLRHLALNGDNSGVIILQRNTKADQEARAKTIKSAARKAKAAAPKAPAPAKKVAAKSAGTLKAEAAIAKAEAVLPKVTKKAAPKAVAVAAKRASKKAPTK